MERGGQKGGHSDGRGRAGGLGGNLAITRANGREMKRVFPAAAAMRLTLPSFLVVIDLRHIGNKVDRAIGRQAASEWGSARAVAVVSWKRWNRKEGSKNGNYKARLTGKWHW